MRMHRCLQGRLVSCGSKLEERSLSLVGISNFGSQCVLLHLPKKSHVLNQMKIEMASCSMMKDVSVGTTLGVYASAGCFVDNNNK